MNDCELAQGIINRGRKISQIKYPTIKQANARVVELELALGQTSDAPPILNIFRANARVEQLEQLLQLKLEKIAAIVPAPITEPVPAPMLTGRARTLAAFKLEHRATTGGDGKADLKFGRERFNAAAKVEL